MPPEIRDFRNPGAKQSFCVSESMPWIFFFPGLLRLPLCPEPKNIPGQGVIDDRAIQDTGGGGTDDLEMSWKHFFRDFY